jgi:hypothetical protein
MDSSPTSDSIKRLVLRLVRPKDRHDLKETVGRFVADDVVFWHSLGLFRGRRAYYSALRVATALWSYERVEFKDVFVSSSEEEEGGFLGRRRVVVKKAALVLVLTIRPRGPLLRLLCPPLDFPTIAVLHFRASPSREGESGRYLLARHVDSNSVVALATALSPLRVPWRLAARWLLPFFGLCGVLAARALDAACDRLDAYGGYWLRQLQLLMD